MAFRLRSAMLLVTHPEMRAMQYGGRPFAGEPMLVGERGPEVFVPDRPGTVVPFGAPQFAEPPPPMMQPRRPNSQRTVEEVLAEAMGWQAERSKLG
jgi:hypothetical protein